MSKHILQTVIEEVGWECEAYSGRGMYGKKCLGVVVRSVGNLIADVIKAFPAGAIPADDMSEQYDIMEDIADAFRSMNTDSLGRDTIVYFEDVPYSEN